MGITIDFNKEKDEILRKTRGVGFIELIEAIHRGGLIDNIEHPNPNRYGEQRILIVNINKYIYCCPYVINQSGWFLKTVYPSRVYRKYYLKKGKIK